MESTTCMQQTKYFLAIWFAQSSPILMVFCRIAFGMHRTDWKGDWNNANLLLLCHLDQFSISWKIRYIFRYNLDALKTTSRKHKFATDRNPNSKRLIFKNENRLESNENRNEQTIFAFCVPCLYLQCNQNLLLSSINRILMFEN